MFTTQCTSQKEGRTFASIKICAYSFKRKARRFIRYPFSPPLCAKHFFFQKEMPKQVRHDSAGLLTFTLHILKGKRDVSFQPKTTGQRKTVICQLSPVIFKDASFLRR